jgi:hypothetical protein
MFEILCAPANSLRNSSIKICQRNIHIKQFVYFKNIYAYVRSYNFRRIE